MFRNVSVSTGDRQGQFLEAVSTIPDRVDQFLTDKVSPELRSRMQQLLAAPGAVENTKGPIVAIIEETGETAKVSIQAAFASGDPSAARGWGESSFARG